MYHTLKTRAFLDKKIATQIIDELNIISCLEECYRMCAFSTFPYIFNLLNSRESIKKTNSGNCIGLSIFIQNLLKKKYNVLSFLIPATIPKKYSHPQYLNISHVALAIPINNKKIFIVDPAFYFLNPIIFDINTMSCTTVFSKNIYEYENSNILKEYTTIDIIKSCPKITNKNIVFNDYQTIKKHTYYAESYYEEEANDKWKYFLTEIMNPDEAITSFFIKVKNNPFIATTIIDSNGICKLDWYVKITPHYIELSKNAGEKKKIFLNTLKNKDKELIDIEKKIKQFLLSNLTGDIKKII